MCEVTKGAVTPREEMQVVIDCKKWRERIRALVARIDRLAEEEGRGNEQPRLAS